MQTIEKVRDRASGSGNWLRLGVVFTTTAAPVIARWNDLRAKKRSLRASEETEARLANPRGETPSRLDGLRSRVVGGRGASEHDQHPQVLVKLPLVETKRTPTARMRSDNVRLGLWLAGVGVGLVAAGTGAYFLARRRMDATADEPLLELPANGARGNGPRGNGPRSKPTASEEGTQNGTATANRSGAMMTMEHDDSPSIPGAAGGFGPADVVEPGMPGPAAGKGRSATPPDEATFVGNIHTMIFHDAADRSHLPAEENRVYFASEDEAREAGYRRDRREVPPASEASITTEGPTA